MRTTTLTLATTICLSSWSCSNSDKSTNLDSDDPNTYPTSTFSGIVYHRVHGAVAGAIVTIDGKSDTTDSGGLFSVADVLEPTGIVTMHHYKVVHDTYNGLEKDTAFGGGQVCSLLVTLTVEEVKQVVEDSYIKAISPHENYGQDSIVCLQYWDSASVHETGVTRIHYKLPQPTHVRPDQVESAVLYLNFVRFHANDSPFGRTVAATVRIIEEEWTETSVTWSNQPKADTAIINALSWDVKPTPFLTGIGVIPAYKSERFPNGIRLSMYGDDMPYHYELRGFIEIASSEYPVVSLRPYVIIRYTY